MQYLIILLIIAAVIALIAHFVQKNGSEEDTIQTAPSCDSCDGYNQKCEQECMMEAATKPIEYFDDEELDDFKGRNADSYTEEEVEQFREVLFTMRQEEVADWNRSLILREIQVPVQLRDELIMMLEEKQ